MVTFAAVFFLAALFLHATSVELVRNQQEDLIHGLLNRIQDNTNEASNLIQGALVDSIQARRALFAQANEWANKIQNANHQLRQMLMNQRVQGQQALEQIANRLSTMRQAILQALNADANQLRNLLRANVLNIYPEASKLGEIALQHAQRMQQNQANVAEELKGVMEELLDANLQLKINRKLLTLNQQDIKSKIQEIANEIDNTIRGINSSNQKVALGLAHQAQEFSGRMAAINDFLRKFANDRLGGATSITILPISSKLDEIRASLDQVAQGRGNAQVWINEIKNQLMSNNRNLAAEMEKLAQLLKFGDESDQSAWEVNNLIRNVVAEVMSQNRRLNWQLRNVAAIKSYN